MGAASAWKYGFPERDKDLTRYSELAAWAFNASFEELEPKVRALGSPIVRVMQDGRRVAGGALIYPMGQWFGGRCIPMTGVAAVTIAPGLRARRLASELMRSLLLEIHEKKVPLSVLYPAVTSLYRQAGYETAGGRYEVKLLLRTFEIRERALEVREFEPGDAAKVLALYNERVKGLNGPIDRASPGWQKLVDIWRGPVIRHGVWNGKHLEGAVSYFPKLREGSLALTEIVSGTPAASRRLLAFLGAHRTQSETCIFHTYPGDPLLAELQPYSHQLRVQSQWMLRIVDVARALEARGYAPGVEAAVELEIRDDVLAHNNRRYRVEVSRGKAQVRRGGRGQIKLDIRGLSALYSSHLPAGELARLTPHLSASPAQLAALQAIFAGPTPWMAEGF
ncbi:MAG: GNAT family N-acetyltransferase [Candidatus Eisenbacteria bacterium]